MSKKTDSNLLFSIKRSLKRYLATDTTLLDDIDDSKLNILLERAGKSPAKNGEISSEALRIHMCKIILNPTGEMLDIYKYNFSDQFSCLFRYAVKTDVTLNTAYNTTAQRRNNDKLKRVLTTELDNIQDMKFPIHIFSGTMKYYEMKFMFPEIFICERIWSTFMVKAIKTNECGFYDISMQEDHDKSTNTIRTRFYDLSPAKTSEYVNISVGKFPCAIHDGSVIGVYAENSSFKHIAEITTYLSGLSKDLIIFGTNLPKDIFDEYYNMDINAFTGLKNINVKFAT